MPDGAISIRSKFACLYHYEKISVPRPDQREYWFEPLKHQMASERNWIHRSQGEVALLTWPRRLVAPCRPAPTRDASTSGRSSGLCCRLEEQQKCCTAKNMKRNEKAEYEKTE